MPSRDLRPRLGAAHIPAYLGGNLQRVHEYHQSAYSFQNEPVLCGIAHTLDKCHLLASYFQSPLELILST